MDVQIAIEAMRPEDWPCVRQIYQQGIATGRATFEVEPPNWDDWHVNHLSIGRLVAWQGPEIVGWSALSPVSRRPCYAGVAELSVYVAANRRRQGVGKALLDALIIEAERNGIWTLQATTFAENEASLGLQRSCGFREVGRRERIASLLGVWRDTVLMERRI